MRAVVEGVEEVLHNLVVEEVPHSQGEVLHNQAKALHQPLLNRSSQPQLSPMASPGHCSHHYSL